MARIGEWGQARLPVSRGSLEKAHGVAIAINEDKKRRPRPFGREGPNPGIAHLGDERVSDPASVTDTA